MLRVPVNKHTNLSEADKLIPFFEWYAKEVKKNPEYGKKRSARDAKRREAIKKKQKSP